ncbi:MAG: hypothetical protein JWM88_3530 [Verrucomicrobia bacterium]|nr:hypothetical protein [Verrucomicrobiota bacterium]
MPKASLTFGILARFVLVAFFLSAGIPLRSQEWDLSHLPDYVPDQKVSGTIRNFGFAMNGLLEAWEKGFARHHPGVKFEDRLPTSDAAVAGLVCEIADLGVSGREPMLTELEAFYDTFGSEMQTITVATGTYDVRTTWSVAIFVNKANPLAQLTMKQLDRIFGASRTGGYEGFRFVSDHARSGKEDIRTWGQLGLKGEWADKPIQTYGYAFTGQAQFFQQQVFHGGDKWNPNYREYVESGSKMLKDDPAGRALGINAMLTELSADKYGIGWTGIRQGAGFPDVKVVALAARDGGPFVAPSASSVQSRQYPLTRSIYLFLKHPTGTALDARLREFLRYILSREGQELVAQNRKYLPLTAEVALEQRSKLD